jgi:dipeptidyl aminopeptidase/acylaminoacyl peptidase
MTEAELRKLLQSEELPGEREAERRSWALLRAEFERREPVPWPRRRLRPLLAVGAAVALLAAALTPPGRGLAERLRDAVTADDPAPITLPAPGRLLVLTDEGPWIIQKDGSKRLLGAYEDAVWSPRGLFVGATRERTLVALEPNGRVRWTLTRPARVSQPRWSPSGFRIAYRSGQALRVVAGDGTSDRLLAPSAGPAPPAWRPGSVHFVAFADRRNRVRIVNTDERRAVFARARVPSTVRELVWSADGKVLLALTDGNEHLLYDAAAKPVATVEQPRAQRAVDAAFAPEGHDLAYISYDAEEDVSSVLLRLGGAKTKTLFTGADRLDGLAWSPDGRWLLVGWPDADQWIFLDVPRVRRVLTESSVAAEFDPGGSGLGRFPRIVFWCCPA